VFRRSNSHRKWKEYLGIVVHYQDKVNQQKGLFIYSQSRLLICENNNRCTLIQTVNDKKEQIIITLSSD
jgi:hypothetical protein